jgi:RNAse (barnase) inhibitor barstar
MKELFMDGKNWRTTDDVYDSFFQAVSAPSWHGRNFNALRDSICTGDTNEIEVPYRLVIQNFGSIEGDARKMAEDFVHLIDELKAQGCNVEIRVE